MTRKQALSVAISVIKDSNHLTEEDKSEVIKGLQLCSDELPLAHWSKAAIFDACDEYLLTHPYIRVKDFDTAGLPSHPAIKNRFGMTAQEFRDKYYPISDVPSRSPYFERSTSEWNELFQAEFQRLGCPGQDRYNRERDKTLPTWNTLATMNGLKRWSELLSICGLKKEPEKQELRVRVVIE